MNDAMGEKSHEPADPRRDHRQFRRGPLYWLGATVAIVLLLVLPVRAIHTVTAEWTHLWAAAYVVAVSAVTLTALGSDKAKARQGLWRIPESALHFLELAGGWPASFMGQRLFRHKTRKSEYQFTFWSIVALHQYVAIDVVHGWQWSKYIFHVARPLLDRVS